MRPRRGFTLVEVLVALGLVAVVGGAAITLLARTEAGGRTAEAAQAATYLTRAMVDAMQKSAPPWLPEENATITLSQDQVRELLQGGGVSYTDPRLYEATVSRAPAPNPGMDRYTIRVCVSPGGQRLCYTQEVDRARVERAYLQPPSGEGEVYTPPSGRAHVQLRIDGDAPGAAQVTLSGPGGDTRSYTKYGVYRETFTPGRIAVSASPARDGRYSYSPSPANQEDTIPAGLSRTFSVTYACATGAAEVAVVPPPSPLSPGTVTLAGQDVTQGGVVPYLSPGSYTVQARRVTQGGYTYDPTYQPSQTLTVAACRTASATVSYVPITGRLRILITAPSGLTPSVRVEGPDSSMPRTLTASATLDNLTPGTYRLLPQDVLQNGVRYRGTPSPEKPVVQAGQTTEAQVEYSPVSARLEVEVRGPSGAPSPRVQVEGPGGYSRSLTAYGTTRLDDLTPGNYRVQASPVSDSLYTYTPSPADTTLSLAAGDRRTHRMDYTAATGALTVQVQGLPAGVSPDVVSVNGTPLSQNPQTFPYLTPGNHTVEARTFTHGGYAYAPDQAVRSVQVSPGATSSVTVAYTRLSGVVEVRVSGLPDPNGATWSLTTPLGTQSGTGPATLTGMPTGSYALTASSVTLGGIRYDPTVSPDQGTLSPGGTLTFTLSYTPRTGNLQLTVNGLSSGAQVEVSRQGGGYSATLDRTTLLTGLTPGTYLVKAYPVTRSEPTPYGTLTYTYAPDPTQGSVEVRAGTTQDAAVAYTRQAGNLVLRAEGLPSGATASVSLDGAGGFRRTESVPGGSTAERRYTDLPTGQYTASGPDVVAGGYTYKASPAQGTLAHGSTLTLTLSYAPADGRLEVQAAGLPAGAPAPTITVRDSNARVVYTATAYSLSLNLVPGTYQVSMSTVDHGGYTWRPDPNPQDARITAGATTRLTFNYVEQAAYIRVSASGLPSGATATGSITGSGYTRTYSLTASNPTTTVKVPLGTYTVSADAFTYNGYSYHPSPQNRTVSASLPGSVYPADFAYQEASGNIAITVSGLPTGTAATLSLSGPVSPSQSCGNGTCSFTRLPFGTYTASASQVRDPLYTYQATLNPTSYTLSSSGQTLTGQARYAPVDGALRIEVAGPTGMPAPTVEVYRGTTRVVAFTGTGTHTAPYLSPGTYRVVPARVDTPDGYYTAPEVSVSIAVGSTATARVTYTYTPTRGTLSLKVSGLPSGVQASINLRNASGSYSQTLSLMNGTYTYSLTPDTYTAIPERVTTPTGNYAAPSASTTITAGQTASLNIAYSLEKGNLTLTVSGLPSGATAAITVSRQGGGHTSTEYLGNGSRTLNLPTGTYTLTANQVYSGAEVYVPNPTSTTLDLTTNGATASFAYSRGAGSLRITLSGVPSGRTANVRITGPGGYSNTLSMGNETRTLSGLNPGTYTVEPGGIQISSFFLWKTIACPNPQRATAGVSLNSTASLSFTYTTATYWWLENPCPIF